MLLSLLLLFLWHWWLKMIVCPFVGRHRVQRLVCLTIWRQFGDLARAFPDILVPAHWTFLWVHSNVRNLLWILWWWTFWGIFFKFGTTWTSDLKYFDSDKLQLQVSFRYSASDQTLYQSCEFIVFYLVNDKIKQGQFYCWIENLDCGQ